ncbi:MAG: response regulator [Marvinbryantia sp.]|jgi:DNA-binding NarL/FixJ family response regulator
MDRIRVIIADDVEEIRQHLSDEISKEEHKIEVVALAKNGQEAFELTREYLPDIVLMDIQMETRTAGINAIAQIHNIFPMIKCIALTIHENEEFIFRAYMAGACDYIIKTNPTEKIVKSIQAVMENKLLLRPEVGQKLIEEYKYTQENQVRLKETLQIMLMINTTEYEILKMVYAGYNYREIAELRYVQETTIRSQINHILKKFNKNKMKDVIKLLRELKIFDD